MPFPSFTGNSFINRNIKKRRVFSKLRRLYVNLLLTGCLMRDLHRIKFTGKGRDVSVPFRRENSGYFVNMSNYILREDSLSSVIVLRRRVFSLFIPLKLRSAAQVDTRYVSKVTRATHIPG